jgi:cyclo(L-tyrosyl-L-tyrosyl) synthase
MAIFENTLSIIGVSPRNPYYADPENIKFALDTILQKRGRAYIMVPDVPDIHNYLAYGYDKEKARKKAFSQGSILKKCIHEICARSGYSYADIGRSLSQVRIINWAEEVETSALYQEKLAEIKALYQVNANFRKDIREVTATSVRSRMSHSADAKQHVEQTGIDLAVDQAIHYIFAEIAFLEVAPKLFGGERTEYVYHRNWEVYENLIKGQYNYKCPNLDFRLLNRTVPQPS